MNILFLTSRFPFPPIGGDRLRPYHFIKELSKRHNIHLLSFVHKSEVDWVDEDIKKRIKISTVKHSHIASCFKTAMNIFKSDPLQVNYYYYKTMQKKLDTIIKEENINLILVHLIRMARYVEPLYSINRIIDYTDSFELLYSRSYKLRQGILKLVDYLERKKTAEYEKRCLSFFEKAIITSDIDKKWIEEGTGYDKIKIISLGVEGSEPIPIHEKNAKAIAFIGNMRSFSNSYAITYFVRHIYPLIKAGKNDAELYVIGASPPKFLKKKHLNDKNIHITGRVADVDMYLNKCCIGVASMMSCSGVQDKILKYMSLKIPVVATSVAVNGLKTVPGRDIIIADSKEDFAREIISFLEDKTKRETIGENGYKYVTSNHNWNNIIEKLDSLLTG